MVADLIAGGSESVVSAVVFVGVGVGVNLGGSVEFVVTEDGTLKSVDRSPSFKVR